MKKLLCAVFVMAAGFFCMGNGVLAAGSAEVAIKGESFQEGTDTWNVTCEIDGDTKITNGKIRVTYDSSQLKLKSSGAGSALSGAMTNINDPVSGNKEEGEIVLAFASASDLDAKGTLMELSFEVLSQVKTDDEVTVSVKTEELMGGGDAVTVTDVPLKIAVGGAVLDPGTDSSGSDTTPDGNTQSTGSDSTDADTSAGIESPDTTAGDAGNSSTTGNVTSDSSQSGDSSAGVNPVKTGDSTNIILPVAALIVALIVLIGGFVWKKKKKDKEDIE